MYGVTTTFPAPVEMYDGMHAEMIRRTGPSVDGLMVHVGRATTNGFEVLESGSLRSTTIAPTLTSSFP
jgi:hypothetical protein